MSWGVYSLLGTVGQLVPNVRHDLLRRWGKAHRTAFADNLTVDQDLELTIPPVNHVDLGLQFTTNPGRHPDGLQTRDSKCTETNGNSRHDGPLIKNLDRADLAPSVFATFGVIFEAPRRWDALPGSSGPAEQRLEDFSKSIGHPEEAQVGGMGTIDSPLAIVAELGLTRQVVQVLDARGNHPLVRRFQCSAAGPVSFEGFGHDGELL